MVAMQNCFWRRMRYEKAIGLKLMPIPFQLLQAFLLSQLVLLATDGEVRKVGFYGGNLLGLLVFYHGISMVLKMKYKKEKRIEIQIAKLSFYQSYLRLPLEKLYHSSVGEDLEHFTNDFDTVMEKRFEKFPSLVAAVAEVLIFGGYLFFLNPMMAVLLLAIGMVQIVPPLIVKKYMQVSYENCRDIEAEITDFILTAFSGFLTIKIYNLTEWWLNRLEKLYARYRRIGKESIYASNGEMALYEFLSQLLSYGTYCIVGVLAVMGKVPLEVGIQGIALSGNFYGALKSSFLLWPKLAVAKVAEERLTQLFASENREEEIEGNEITLENVSFSYNREILKDASFSMDHRAKILLRGANGAGKSTLLKLLTGLERPEKGKVLLGKVKAGELSRKMFSGKVLYLPQDDPMLSITGEALYDEILKRDKEEALGYTDRFGLNRKTVSNQEIAALSGGERKKIFLALALAVKPPFLLLDEPTNHLDEKGKQILAACLTEYSGGFLMVTHDQLMEKLDARVCVLREGRLYDKG